MGILADQVDYVIGVDTHRDAHSAAIVAALTGAVTNTDVIRADAFGQQTSAPG
jgi:tRNA/tmRNA/rRNA uracil-C5-methylase (TrmA/RlmC/RlmD family)